jgi:two-component system OmpR family sensor kinase
VSLRIRLLIAIGVVAIFALVVADVATYRALEGFLYQRVNAQLDQFHGAYEQQAKSGQGLICLAPGQTAIGGPPGGIGLGGGGGSARGRLPNFQLPAAEVRTTSGALVGGDACPAYVNGTQYTPLIQGTIGGFSKAPDGTEVAYFNAPSKQAGGPGFRVRASTLDDGNLLIVAQPLGDTVSTLNRLFLIELAVTVGAIVVALLAGFWLVRLGLRPLREMERSAELIAAGDLTERVPGENENTEVGRLARTLNMMLARIESAFGARLASEQRLRASEARLRQFVADASHELRTPIAAISAYAELFGRGASEQKEDLERVMDGIRGETGRMEHLVADLLLLARLDEGRPLELRSVDLVALCAEAVHTASTVGPEWPLTFVATEPIEVMGDATALRQVVDNLLGNVRAHTPPGTTVQVATSRDADGAVIAVADDGPGMTAEEAEHIFERFYRSDPSRSRLHGGAGLGLSIVSAIVQAHGGSVGAEGQAGVGTTFTVRLPINPQGPDGESSGADASGLAAGAAPPESAAQGDVEPAAAGTADGGDAQTGPR